MAKKSIGNISRTNLTRNSYYAQMIELIQKVLYGNCREGTMIIRDYHGYGARPVFEEKYVVLPPLGKQHNIHRLCDFYLFNATWKKSKKASKTFPISKYFP
eukprot:snap_masked-scaffold_20-processed-gene-3.16-mRNA-1 protein AED:1.00 eAED:1.00 QI:0/0/0/0/1/1/2/0/100